MMLGLGHGEARHGGRSSAGKEKDMMVEELQTWPKDQLIEAVCKLRRENASLQLGIGRFLTGNGRSSLNPLLPKMQDSETGGK
jgi:hypothetical protein